MQVAVSLDAKTVEAKLIPHAGKDGITASLGYPDDDPRSEKQIFEIKWCGKAHDGMALNDVYHTAERSAGIHGLHLGHKKRCHRCRDGQAKSSLKRLV